MPALLLRITRHNTTIFYGHDSGIYPKQTLDALADGPPIDIALFDCTYGPAPCSNRGHMGVWGIIQMAAELRSRGALASHAHCIATHFSHGGGALHEELLRAFAGHQIEVAFDGMKISAAGA